MRPIIFVRIASMLYYQGITDKDSPVNGGSYVKETGQAHECFNFAPAELEDGRKVCLGYAQLTGGSDTKEPELHIEKIVGCNALKKEEFVDNVIVVWCAKSPGSQNVRGVGFYQHATVFRYHQWVYFSDGYEQCYEFVAEAKDCVLLPYQVRHSDSRWYVPTSSRNKAAFGLGRSSIWYAGNGDADEAEINYVERMIQSIEGYSGENWMERENAK